MTTDTTPAARRAQLSAYRRMTGGQRVAIAAQMSDDARAIALAGIRARHPNYSDDEARHPLLRLLLGDELYRRAWPAAPLVAP